MTCLHETQLCHVCISANVRTVLQTNMCRLSLSRHLRAKSCEPGNMAGEADLHLNGRLGRYCPQRDAGSAPPPPRPGAAGHWPDTACAAPLRPPQLLLPFATASLPGYSASTCGTSPSKVDSHVTSVFLPVIHMYVPWYMTSTLYSKNCQERQVFGHSSAQALR
jgi:hypothetical protein